MMINERENDKKKRMRRERPVTYSAWQPNIYTIRLHYKTFTKSNFK